MTPEPTDKHREAARKLLHHDQCPHWMDDNFYCPGCSKVKPVAAFLAQFSAAKDREIAELRKELERRNRLGYERKEAEGLVTDWMKKMRERAEQAEARVKELESEERACIYERLRPSLAARAIAKEFRAGCTHHTLEEIIRQLRAELAAMTRERDESREMYAKDVAATHRREALAEAGLSSLSADCLAKTAALKDAAVALVCADNYITLSVQDESGRKEEVVANIRAVLAKL